MDNFISLKMYANLAKTRMLNSKDIPQIIGLVPYKYIDICEKSLGSKETFYKMCKMIENGQDITSLKSLIDKDTFEEMSPEERQRYILRLAEVFRRVKHWYQEYTDEIMYG